ncbi:hypothetical protein [Planococcus sp. CP5-4_UN]|uniref:hypothetical protein n=1 Tax=Planococcus sp. CP5-4_UN TaxID=2850852 RepID=UPI0020B80C28|nr:hypothetical protein [Planococcus sp. CP5-4_UN]
MILLIDHYDSFTYNIYQAIAALGEEVYDSLSTMKKERLLLFSTVNDRSKYLEKCSLDSCGSARRPRPRKTRSG